MLRFAALVEDLVGCNCFGVLLEKWLVVVGMVVFVEAMFSVSEGSFRCPLRAKRKGEIKYCFSV